MIKKTLYGPELVTRTFTASDNVSPSDNASGEKLYLTFDEDGLGYEAYTREEVEEIHTFLGDWLNRTGPFAPKPEPKQHWVATNMTTGHTTVLHSKSDVQRYAASRTHTVEGPFVLAVDSEDAQS